MISALRKTAFRIFGTLMPALAAGWFERTMLKPRPVPVPDIPTPEAARTMKRIPYAGGWISVFHWGEGPAVLLLHGWGGASYSLAAYVDPLVKAGYRAVAFDAPAHGESTGVRTNLIEYADAAIRVGNAFGPLHGIIAHSFGGSASALAAKHGLAFNRLAILAAPLSIYDLTLELCDVIGLPRKVGELMVEKMARRLQFEWRDIATDRLVSHLEVPLLVVHDRDDKTVPFSNGEQIAGAASRSELMATDSLGHRGILTDRDVISRVVGFIATADARSKKSA